MIIWTDFLLVVKEWNIRSWILCQKSWKFIGKNVYEPCIPYLEGTNKFLGNCNFPLKSIAVIITFTLFSDLVIHLYQAS